MNAALNRLLDTVIGALDLFRFWVVLYEYERGVILRLGRPHRDLGPGIHWRLPLRIEELRFVNIRKKTSNSWDMTFTLATGKTVTVAFVIIIEIIDAHKVLLELDDWENTAYSLTKIAISKALIGQDEETVQAIDFVKTVRQEVEQLLTAVGIGVSDFGFQDIALCRAYKFFSGASYR